NKCPVHPHIDHRQRMPIQPIQATLELLSRDSRLGHSSSDTVAYLMDLLYYGEFQIFEQVSSGAGLERVNLLGTKGQHPSDDGLWLVSTFNTGAQPHPAHWASTDGTPMTGRRRDAAGMVYGLGANSGKIDMVLKILAASRFRLEELRRPIHVAALSGEEALGTGIHALLDSGPTVGGAVLVGAPTNLEIWTDHPGCIVLKLTLDRKLRHRRMPPCRGFFELHVPGSSAHAQLPAIGTDALARGLEVVEQLRKDGDVRLLGFDAGEAPNRVAGQCRIQIATVEEDLPRLDGDIQTSQIADGTALPFPIDALFSAWFAARDAGIEAIGDRLGHTRNVVAARPKQPWWTGKIQTDRNAVSGTVMLWTGPGVDARDICERFAHAAQTALIGEEELSVSIQVSQDRPAFAGGEGNDRLLSIASDALTAAGIPPVHSGGIHTSDAGILRARGIETLVFGPGRGLGDLYRDDEAIPLQHLEAAYRFYEQVIKRWCVDE
ncbi:MAG: acetylornithine deacetylase/succinyl-diaminopimelate desuccinylase-like protein, partial [Myxococcota bacterium]